MGFELRAIYKAGESESIERWTNTLLVQSGITRPTDRSPQTESELEKGQAAPYTHSHVGENNLVCISLN